MLVADPQRLVCEALCRALLSSGLDVIDDHPLTGKETHKAVVGARPDLTVMDYWMPDIEAPMLVHSILRDIPEHRIIVLSWFYSAEQIQRTLEAGAAGFLPKSSSMDELVEGIQLAHLGQSPVFPQELESFLHTLSQKRDSSDEVAARLATLTPRELEILSLLAHEGSIAEVAERLFLSRGTIKNHISNILRKTGAKSSSQAVAWARHCGLIRH